MSWLRLMEETIKENEAVPEGETALIQPVLPQRKHGIAQLVKNMWPAYLIEIIVIILGISITLALEEWRDNRKEMVLEQSYLKNLLSDAETDIVSLVGRSEKTKTLLERGSELLDFVRNPKGKQLSSKEVYEDVRAILDRPNFISRDVTFSDLKSSGNLHLIKDIRLKNLLFSYYNETQNIRELQNAEQQATIILTGAYFIKRFPMFDKSDASSGHVSDDVSEFKSAEFGNNVLLRVLNRKELLEIYQRADTLAISLKKELTLKIE
jgi:hypothetical protein